MGTLEIKDGVAHTDQLVAALSEGVLSGKGNVNLVDQGIRMRVTAVLASPVSNSIGGSSIGGFLSTALANSKGELVIPVQVTGSLSKPIFTPDTEAIAQMKLKNLLPTTGDPTVLSTGLLNSLSGKRDFDSLPDSDLPGLIEELEALGLLPPRNESE